MLDDKNLIPQIPNRGETGDNDPNEDEPSCETVLDDRHHLEFRFDNTVNPPFTPEEAKVDRDGQEETAGDCAVEPVESFVRGADEIS